ncbi:MAG: Serine--tRNA ligase [Actinobacteria bacterium ADurb.Bin444]|nr:MAG: Serine--tRNA ligase [Actinobacteria bacterium ADurb.Bin444]
MLDIKLIRSDPDAVRQALRRRGGVAEHALDTLLALDTSRRELLVQVEEKRNLRNSVSEEIAKAKKAGLGGPEVEAKVAAMREVGVAIKDLDAQLKEIEAQLEVELLQVPNLPDPTAPAGGEEESREERRWGTPRQFDFPPRDHLDLAAPRDLIDMERGAKVGGSRFAYLKGDLVFLQFALVQYALHKLAAKGFRPVVPPVLVRDEAMYGTGFFPTDIQQVYQIEADALNLVGTSEVPLAALHMNEILDEADLPVRYVGYSTCFRREAGAAGKDTRGIFRVHQFDKVEMFSFCHPDSSREEHDFMWGIEREILEELGLPYRSVNIAAGDLGASAAKKYDNEAWIPSQERYREVTSCSNCTDYQSRRLKCRAKGEKGGPYLVHTLNGTVVAVGRTIIAIMENFQTADGLIEVPSVLRPHIPGAPEYLGA